MPTTKRVALMPMPGMGNGHGGVLYNAKMGMVACTGWLPAPPKGKSYQLWLVPMEGKPMPLYVFGEEWTEPMEMHVTPGMEAKAFAVTEEPAGGMPWPTGPKVLVGAGERRYRVNEAGRRKRLSGTEADSVFGKQRLRREGDSGVRECSQLSAPVNSGCMPSSTAAIG